MLEPYMLLIINIIHTFLFAKRFIRFHLFHKDEAYS